MIEPQHKRLAAIHWLDDATCAAVWVAHDRQTDKVMLYDACQFKANEVLDVIAGGLNARGSWIPIAWEQSRKEMADALFDKGCNMEMEGIKETDVLAQVVVREIDERMRTGRFEADSRFPDLGKELDEFNWESGHVSQGTSPYVAALRLAIIGLPGAVSQQRRKSAVKIHAQKVAII